MTDKSFYSTALFSRLRWNALELYLSPKYSRGPSLRAFQPRYAQHFCGATFGMTLGLSGGCSTLICCSFTRYSLPSTLGHCLHLQGFFTGLWKIVDYYQRLGYQGGRQFLLEEAGQF
jgi:hypothetical protein